MLAGGCAVVGVFIAGIVSAEVGSVVEDPSGPFSHTRARQQPIDNALAIMTGNVCDDHPCERRFFTDRARGVRHDPALDSQCDQLGTDS